VRRTAAFLVLLIVVLMQAASAADKQSRWRILWHVSQAMLAGADAADAASSWGKIAANPLVRTGARFSYGSVVGQFEILSP
jgi:hypothetical protein